VKAKFCVMKNTKRKSELFTRMEEHRLTGALQILGGGTDPSRDPGSSNTNDDEYTYIGGPDCGDNGSLVTADTDPTDREFDTPK
jgi:hypothetical protein